jgi:hypothetical protein
MCVCVCVCNDSLKFLLRGFKSHIIPFNFKMNLTLLNGTDCIELCET